MQREGRENERGLLFIKVTFTKVHLAEIPVVELVLEVGRTPKR